ncbi:MAG: hypothetical protein RSE41_05190 [Clostridia bacterium]
MSRFNDNGFYIKDNKVYKVIDGCTRLITLLKPNYCRANFDMNETEFNMENTDNLINADLIKYIVDNSTCTLKDIDIEPYLIRQIAKGLDLYAIDISKLWDFHNYDSYVSIIYYSAIDEETNQLMY